MARRQENYKAYSKDMRDIIDQAKALVDATAGEVDERIKQAREELLERLESGRFDYAELREKVRENVQAADELVHAKPYYAIGATFVSGLQLGWLMSRR